MLIEIAIRDLALIEGASLTFGAGLNVITGETGAGKSLLIGALELLLGERARSGLVRKGASQASVEGRFALAREGYGELVRQWLAEHLPDTLDEAEAEEQGGELELILTRSIGRDGRSRAHVNHRPVTQRMLRGLAAQLVEIHGQNDHQKLFEPDEQRRLLDTFGDLGGALAGYRERRDRWSELAARLEDFEAGEAERLQRLDLLRFQASELAEAAPSADEHDALDAEREVLRHAGALSTELGGLLQALAEREDAALDVLRRTERSLDHWETKVGELAEPAARVRDASAHLESAVASLVSFVDGVEADPARLEAVEGRLGELERLERKYRTDAAGLVQRHAQLEAELEELVSEGGDREGLAASVDEAREALAESARRLRAARAELATPLREAVEAGLAELGLAKASFEVALVDAPDDEPFGPGGSESVEFLLAANPGESRQALRRVASGGEAARTMLALRGALAVRQSTPTLVFDEVDAGVGGRLGPKVGGHLADLARHHQILCVTHLPAIAAVADRHMRVVKETEEGRTRTHVSHLAGDQRVEEVADMIAGGSHEPTALAEARRLLEGASKPPAGVTKSATKNVTKKKKRRAQRQRP